MGVAVGKYFFLQKGAESEQQRAKSRAPWWRTWASWQAY